MNYPFGMTQSDHVKICKDIFRPFFPLGSTWPKDPTHLTSLPGSVRVGIRAALVPCLFGDGHFAQQFEKIKKMCTQIYIFFMFIYLYWYIFIYIYIHGNIMKHLSTFQTIAFSTSQFAALVMVLPVHRWLHDSFRLFRFQTMAPKGATYFIILGIPSINRGPLRNQ